MNYTDLYKPKVLLINPTIYPEGVKILEKNAEVIYAPNGDRDTLKKYLSQGVNAVILRIEQMDKELIESARDLRVIGANGVGYSNIDLEAATCAGVAVVNVVGANFYSVAEHIVMFSLAMARDLKRADHAVRNGFWQYRDEYPLHDIHGNTFFSVGLGNIGKEVCRVMKSAFNMDIYVYDPFFSKETIEKFGFKKAETFQEGASCADYVSLHLPANEDTYHLINANTIKVMKPGCKFINCARGPIVDYDALCDALESGQIGMACVDVFPEEPVSKDHRIFKLDNVIATPHCAGDTAEARARISISVANDVIAVLKKRRPRCLVNKELELQKKDLFED